MINYFSFIRLPKIEKSNDTWYWHWDSARGNVKCHYNCVRECNSIYKNQFFKAFFIFKNALFIAALFTIARTWKQPRCPSTDKWIKKLWYIYTMEYYSAIKRNTFESVLMRWLNLAPVIQSKVSQKEKDKYCILMHIYGI